MLFSDDIVLIRKSIEVSMENWRLGDYPLKRMTFGRAEVKYSIWNISSTNREYHTTRYAVKDHIILQDEIKYHIILQNILDP